MNEDIFHLGVKAFIRNEAGGESVGLILSVYEYVAPTTVSITLSEEHIACK